MWGIVSFGASLITIAMAGLRARQATERETTERDRDITIGESDVRPEQPPLDAAGPGVAPVIPSTT